MTSDLVMAVYEATVSTLQAQKDLDQAVLDFDRGSLYLDQCRAAVERTKIALERAIDAWQDAQRPARLTLVSPPEPEPKPAPSMTKRDPNGSVRVVGIPSLADEMERAGIGRR